MESISDSREQPILNIVGEKVALGPLRRDLLPLYQRWDNDFALLLLEEGLACSSTLESTERSYEQSGKNERTVRFVIYERTTMRPIGRTDLHEVDHVARTANFSIGIAEKDCWGKGYGSETTRLMLDYGFTCLGLHNIMLFVYSFNERAIRAYTRAGFREIGRRREAIHLGGRAYDAVYMDCLATEFQSRMLRHLLPES